MSRNTKGSPSGVFEALAHPTRRDILRYLRSRDYVRAGDVGEALDVVPSTLSGHLRTLREAGLVETRRRGTEIQYRVQMTVLDEAILLLQGLRPTTADRDTAHQHTEHQHTDRRHTEHQGDPP